MSFDKNYPNRKDHRRPYYGSKAFDSFCRNHGSCPYCAEGRQHSALRRAPADLEDQIKAPFLGLSHNDTGALLEECCEEDYDLECAGRLHGKASSQDYDYELYEDWDYDYDLWDDRNDTVIYTEEEIQWEEDYDGL